MDHWLDYGSSPTGSRNMVSVPNDVDFMGGQDIKRWSATPSQHHQTINADNHHQANPFCWTCYKKRKAGILDADWENRGQKSTGSPTFDISRLVVTIYWPKTTGPYHKVAKTTRDRCCGCRQRQDSGMTLGLDWSLDFSLCVSGEYSSVPFWFWNLHLDFYAPEKLPARWNKLVLRFISKYCWLLWL